MKTKGGREQAGAGPALPWLAVAGLAGIVRSCRIGGGGGGSQGRQQG